MTLLNALQHAAFAMAVFLWSIGVTRAAISLRIMDIPNQRSSHHMPTPKSGGVGIVTAFMAGQFALYFLATSVRLSEPYFIGLIAGSLAVAIVSLLDDVRQRSLSLRFMTQVVATATVLASGMVIREVWLPVVGRVDLGVFGYLLTAVWIIGLTNAVNFMDGLNGLVAGSVAIAAAFMAAVCFLTGSHFAYLLALSLCASVAGFIPFNFPRARVFMGDVGSQFLGFSFAVLGVIAAQFDLSRTSFMIVPILLFALLFDAILTFSLRVIRRERVLQPHRTHLYQLLNRSGWSHARVSSLYFAFAVLQGLAALTFLALPANARILVFAPLLILHGAYALWVHDRFRRVGS